MGHLPIPSGGTYLITIVHHAIVIGNNCFYLLNDRHGTKQNKLASRSKRTVRDR